MHWSGSLAIGCPVEGAMGLPITVFGGWARAFCRTEPAVGGCVARSVHHGGAVRGRQVLHFAVPHTRSAGLHVRRGRFAGVDTAVVLLLVTDPVLRHLPHDRDDAAARPRSPAEADRGTHAAGAGGCRRDG